MLGKQCANKVYNKDSVSFSEIVHKNEKKIVMQFVVRAHKGEQSIQTIITKCHAAMSKKRIMRARNTKATPNILKGGISQPNTATSSSPHH